MFVESPLELHKSERIWLVPQNFNSFDEYRLRQVSDESVEVEIFIRPVPPDQMPASASDDVVKFFVVGVVADLRVHRMVRFLDEPPQPIVKRR